MRNANNIWDNNEIQFARLICELDGAIDPDDDAVWESVRESMDVTVDELRELLDRADIVFQTAKHGILSLEHRPMLLARLDLKNL